MPQITICLNTHTFAASQFFNHQANSAVLFNGKLLFARSTGLYESTGDNDGYETVDGAEVPIAIDAWAVLPITDLEYNGQKTPRSLLVDGYINGKLQFSLTDENQVTRDFQTPELLSYDGVKIALRSDQRSRFFKLKIANVDGAGFSVKGIDIVYIPGPERRK